MSDGIQLPFCFERPPRIRRWRGLVITTWGWIVSWYGFWGLIAVSGIGASTIMLWPIMLGLTATSPEHDRRVAAAAAVENKLAVADDAVFLADLLDVPQTPELRTLYDAMEHPFLSWSSSIPIGLENIA